MMFSHLISTAAPVRRCRVPSLLAAVAMVFHPCLAEGGEPAEPPPANATEANASGSVAIAGAEGKMPSHRKPSHGKAGNGAAVATAAAAMTTSAASGSLALEATTVAVSEDGIATGKLPVSGTEGSATGGLAVARVAAGSDIALAPVAVAADGAETMVKGRYGSLAITAAGAYRYVPDDRAQVVPALQTVEDSFIYEVTAAAVEGIAPRLAGLRVVIAGANDAPVARADTWVVAEDAGVFTPAGGLLANDSDVDDATTLTVTRFAAGIDIEASPIMAGSQWQGHFGRLRIDPDGTLTFAIAATAQALAARATEPLVFSYEVSDRSQAANGRATAAVTLSLTGANDPPRLIRPVADQQAVAGEDYSLALGGYFADVDGPAPLSLSVSGQPGWLRFDSGANTLGGTPQVADITAEPTQVSLTVRDGASGLLRVGFPLAVVAPSGDQPPTAVADTLLLFGTATGQGDLLANDFGRGPGGKLAVARAAAGRTLANQPAALGRALKGTYGQLTVAKNGRYDYLPLAAAEALPAGRTVTDEFTYQLLGNNRRSNDRLAAILTVTLVGVDDRPVAVDDALAVVADEPAPPLNVISNADGRDFDPDRGDRLSVLAVARGRSFGLSAVAAGEALQGDFGTLRIAANGDLSYRPNAAAAALPAGVSKEDWFTYRVGDDARGGVQTATATVTVTVTGANDAPALTTPFGNQVAHVNSPYILDLPAHITDVDPGAAVTFTLSGNLPAWLRFDAAAGRLRGVPAPADATRQVLPIAVVARDEHGALFATRLDLRVVSTLPNHSPEAVDDILSTHEDTTGTGNLLANDRDRDGQDILRVARLAAGSSLPRPDIKYSSRLATLEPSGELVVAGRYGTLRVRPDGAYRYLPGAEAQELPWDAMVEDVFAYELRDDSGAGNDSASAILAVRIKGLNDAPVAAPAVADTVADQALSVGALLNVKLPLGLFADPERDRYEIALRGADGGVPPAWLALMDVLDPDPLPHPAIAAVIATTANKSPLAAFADLFQRYRLVGLPTAADLADSPVTVVITATDAIGAVGELPVTVTLKAANTPPRLVQELVDLTADPNRPFSMVVPAGTFEDAEGEGVSYTISQLPRWLRFDGAAGRLTGMPTPADAGSVIPLIVTARDPDGLIAQTDFKITVLDPNLSPVAVHSLPEVTAVVGQSLFFTVPGNVFRDGNLDELRLTATMAQDELPGDQATEPPSLNPSEPETPVSPNESDPPHGSWLADWLFFDGTAFRGTPTAASLAGSPYDISVTAHDDRGGQFTARFTLTVVAVDGFRAVSRSEESRTLIHMPYLIVRRAGAFGGASCVGMSLSAPLGSSSIWRLEPDSVTFPRCELPADVTELPVVDESFRIHVPTLWTEPGAGAEPSCAELTFSMAGPRRVVLTAAAAKACPALAEPAPTPGQEP